MRYLGFLLLYISVLSADAFTLKSNDLGGQLTKSQEFNSFGCSGDNISPELHWSHPPKGTKSFAITIYDEDAPTGSGWWHWAVVNIPVGTSKIETGASGKKMPKGTIEVLNDYGTIGFGGACPPKGDKAHRYVITVYALDIDTLPIKQETNDPVVGYQINAHTISKASMISYYQR